MGLKDGFIAGIVEGEFTYEPIPELTNQEESYLELDPKEWGRALTLEEANEFIFVKDWGPNDYLDIIEAEDRYLESLV